MLWSKNSGTKMKNLMSRIISGLDVAGERISELEDISIDISKGKQILKKKDWEKREKRTDWILWDNYKILICAYLKYQREKKKWQEIFETYLMRISSKLMSDTKP